MTVMLDASVLVSMFVADTNAPRVRAFLARGPQALAVSTFGIAEFASAISRYVRIGSATRESGDRLLAAFDAWADGIPQIVEVEPVDHRAAGRFVRRFDLALRAPDALHIAICHRLGLPLLTFDARQAAAARALGVACDPAGAA